MRRLGTLRWAFSLILLACVGAIAAGTLPAEDGIVAHWSFNEDEVEGKLLLERVQGLNGIIEGDPFLGEGVVGSALFFDGIDDRVVFPENVIEVIAKLKQGTIAFWFKFDYNLDRQEIQPMFYLGVDDERKIPNHFIIEIGHRRPRNLKLYVTWVVNNRVPLCYDSGFNLIPGEWYHLALVVSEQGNTGYLNGVELVRRHYNFGNAGMQMFLADVPAKELFVLGYGKTARGISPNFLYFQGALDEVRIYSRPLSASEVLKLYQEQEGKR